MSREKISCVLITLNAEKTLSAVLASVTWCDEILILDSGSTDKTKEIAEKYGARFIYQPWLGFGPQKHKAVELAAHDWVFSIDADEEVSLLLQEEILLFLNDPKKIKTYSGITATSYNIFMGRKIGPWGRAGSQRIHIFNRRTGNFNLKPVHEQIEVKGSVMHFNGALLHYSYADLAQYFDKFNSYTSIAAKDLYNKHETYSRFLIISRWPIKFLGMYFMQGYFICGWAGFVWCWLSSCYGVVKYLKLDEFYLKEAQAQQSVRNVLI